MPQSAPLLRRLKALVAFRVLFVTALLGTFLIFRIGLAVLPYPDSTQYIIVLLYGLTIAYGLLINRLPVQAMAYAQHTLDCLTATLLIAISGGVESWFSWVILLVVISAAIVTGRRAAYIAATMGAILYGALLDMQFYATLPIPYHPGLLEKDFLYKMFSHMMGLYITAYLMGELVSRLERRDRDLRELTHFNREVFESSPAGIFTTDSEGRLLLFNRAAEDITGLQRAEALGMPVLEVFPFIGDLMDTRRRESTLRLPGGEERVLGMSLSPLLDHAGLEKGHIGIFQDLTEMKNMARLVKQKESLAAVGELSARIAHEIRNPLASLKGSIEMLREGTMSLEQSERLMDIALSEMDRLNTIITDFLSYSRPTPPVVETFDLNEALSEVFEMLKNRASTPVAFIREFSGKFPVRADQKKLKEVFWNLGINALEAMPEGGTLTVGTQRHGNTAEVFFQDTGQGLKSEDRERIFFPFFTTKKHGTGLGLSTAYRVTEAHGGTILLQSAPGKGARFTITLPEAL